MKCLHTSKHIAALLLAVVLALTLMAGFAPAVSAKGLHPGTIDAGRMRTTGTSSAAASLHCIRVKRVRVYDSWGKLWKLVCVQWANDPSDKWNLPMPKRWPRQWDTTP